MNEEANKAYQDVLKGLTALMVLDPDKESPEGELIINVAKACSDYEKNFYFTEKIEHCGCKQAGGCYRCD